MKSRVLAGYLLVFFLLISKLQAEIKTTVVEYQEGDTLCEGLFLTNPNWFNNGPAILIAHQWKGLTDYERKRAEMLVELGYRVFCADIYGKGIRASSPSEAAPIANSYKNDRPLLKRRINAALATLREQSGVNTNKIAAIGYCFGGTTVLELARSGAELKGVVSFHGGLNTPNPKEAQSIRCKVLALHGADDPFVPEEEVKAFQEEMRQAKIDWHWVAFGGAVHSFTDWNAGSDPARGAAYNPDADRRSWEAMKIFFKELFQ